VNTWLFHVATCQVPGIHTNLGDRSFIVAGPSDNVEDGCLDSDAAIVSCRYETNSKRISSTTLLVNVNPTFTLISIFMRLRAWRQRRNMHLGRAVCQFVCDPQICNKLAVDFLVYLYF